ncbi:DapH/DapD/GlmU-related protein [Algoriphagus sp. C2-6-M1]|uniref:DapH/DapD/GlmU-related protein n=1 Tax=Algoriphagus persicinus TaxID=3108754 RepID=UPI002B38EDA7|nr:DapH/DapD/GlmU-related protein [Algoriphagus sp. C2-6-M1]MEB2782655.1 DapH/DapD/GlmU-related protein [Algoriphagus sp. C2-6-M1]
MILLDDFIQGFSETFPNQKDLQPWEITDNLKDILHKMISHLGEDYKIEDGIAVHKTAIVEKGVVMKSPVIVNKNCYIGANAYFREGVYLDHAVKVGPGCEIKSSIICSETAIAHFNYIGNSILGKYINFEAGSIAANHYNERASNKISVVHNSNIIETGTEKFGSLVGDNSRIGANAVLSPGTILEKSSIVKRLELIEQCKTE